MVAERAESASGSSLTQPRPRGTTNSRKDGSSWSASAPVSVPGLAARLARWERLAGQLAEVSALGFIDAQPARLAEDLGAAASLAAMGQTPELPEPPPEVRIVALDATSSGSCLLADVVADPAAASAAAGARLTLAPLAAGNLELGASVRAELIDAHAVVLVVGYRDVVMNLDGKRAADAADLIGAWLPLAADIAAPELLTVVVDGVEASNSNPASRLAWTRHRVHAVLPLPAGWPSDGVIEMSSRRALQAAEDERAGKVPPGHLAWALDAYGIDAVMERALIPFRRDPVRWFTESALRRARAVFSLAAHEFADQLRSRPPAGPVDPDAVLLPRYARQRQAWLLSIGLASSLASAVPQLTDAIHAIKDGVGT